ncbi:hypothetical protein [Pseudorhodoplanes sp.]|uniref:hypothetical protein n=1 Tax=Pseudorhodoplanes sp. TaxID=1934341 RepID=UPI002C4DBD2A|nr:hypothetical protein [Pseudorhodoplanes sp.]HWV41583.1 hypothetical protein [Pseudorhodoplanes sp.]
MADGTLVERLRQYLRGLSPEARALLMTELERGLLRGEDVAGAELVLQELRRDARETARPKRPGNLARLFFQPLEPFLVDDTATHSHPGRIARVVLEPMWEWICRDLMPGEAKAVTEQVARAFEDGDAQRAEELARAFQDRVATRMEEALAAASADEKARRRISGQIGTPRALDDVRAILTVIKSRHTLARFGAQLPSHIKTLDDSNIDAVKAIIEAPTSGGPVLFVPVLVMTMGRLAAPWQLVRLATRAAGTDNATRIAETPYAVTVDIVLAEIQRLISELKAELRSGQGLAVGALLKSIHDSARGLRAEINFSHESPWARALAALRTQVSDLLKGEIETLPARVRRLLRPRPIKEIAPNSTLDETDVSDTEAQIAFVNTCRAYAGELALSELTTRTWTDLEHYLDPATAALVENLRVSGESDRPFRQSQLDAAVRFCRKVFGEDYAALLLKARNVAAAAERKAAKG